MQYAIKAEEIARKWHSDQFRRDGITPYITHPAAVAEAVDGDFAKSVAWLHDVLEDTECPLSVIYEFPLDIFYAVFRLSKNLLPKTTYLDYIKYVNNLQLSRIIKIEDIKHNLSCKPSPKKTVLYKEALEILLN